MTHCLMFNYNTICNHSSPQLADIIHFDSLLIVIHLTILKLVYYEDDLALL